MIAISLAAVVVGLAAILAAWHVAVRWLGDSRLIAALKADLVELEVDHEETCDMVQKLIEMHNQRADKIEALATQAREAEVMARDAKNAVQMRRVR